MRLFLENTERFGGPCIRRAPRGGWRCDSAFRNVRRGPVGRDFRADGGLDRDGYGIFDEGTGLRWGGKAGRPAMDFVHRVRRWFGDSLETHGEHQAGWGGLAICGNQDPLPRKYIY